jgi:hypothetical protein
VVVTSRPRTTVAIPLHASAPWFEVVEANLGRLAGHARVVVSDPTGLDDTLPRLRAAWGHVEGIEWRTAATAPGWVAHCNALLAEATTEYFMWLPHDDEIDSEWVAEAERALERDASAILAVGDIVPIAGGVEFPFNTAYTSPDPDERVAAALADIVDGRARALGLLYRSVFRRGEADPLPDSEWGDVPWAIGMLATGRAARLNAVYRKRWHPGSVSASWSPMLVSPGLRSTHIAEAVARVGASAPALLAQAWEREVTSIATSRTALAVELHAVRRSSSWRLTSPLRWLRARLRSSRAGGQHKQDPVN